MGYRGSEFDSMGYFCLRGGIDGDLDSCMVCDQGFQDRGVLDAEG